MNLPRKVDRGDAAALSTAGGSPVGNVEAGAVAALTSPAFSAVSGGIGCVAAAVLIGLAFPAFRRYQGQVAAEQKPTATAVSASKGV